MEILDEKQNPGLEEGGLGRWPKGRPPDCLSAPYWPNGALREAFSQKWASGLSALFPRDPGSRSWRNRGNNSQKQLEPVGERKGDLEDGGQGRRRRGQERIAPQAGKGHMGKLGLCRGSGNEGKSRSAQIPRGRRRAGSGRVLGLRRWARGRASGEAREGARARLRT